MDKKEILKKIATYYSDRNKWILNVDKAVKFIEELIEDNEIINVEKVELMRIWKQNGIIECNFSYDCNDYELYGFLKFLLKDMEKKLELTESGKGRFYND